MTMEGHPLPIVFKNEEAGTFELNEAALAGVLLSPEIADKRVSVVAVAGAFRTGKTFLLDFLLRYCTNRNSQNWLGDKSCPLRGFKWRQGYERETTGIHIWSKPFIVERSNGEEIALILMDTQGTFDSESPMKDSTVVFALSLLVSSTLVYNLFNNIQEDDLTNLQTFTSYGLHATSETDDSTAFQKLVFLVRDWNSPAQLPYGNKGGEEFLGKKLKIKSCQGPAHQDLRRDLRKCFTDIDCYLMPRPGDQAIENTEFKGRLSEIDPNFVKHLEVFVPLLLAPQNLVEKKFGGQTIRAKGLFDSFKMFIETFKSSQIEEPTTMTECMARAASQAALGAAKEDYVRSMDAIVGQNQAIGMDKLRSDHENFKREAVKLYKEKNKFGARTKRIFKLCKKQLVNEIDEICYVQYMPRVIGQAALKTCLDKYSAAIENLIMNKESTEKLQILKDKRLEKKQKAISYFQEENTSRKQNATLFNEYQSRLEREIEELFEVKFSEASSEVARETCEEQYKEAMDRQVQDKNYPISLKELAREHETQKNKVINDYHENKGIKRKNDAAVKKNLDLLKDTITHQYQVEYFPRVCSQTALEASKKQYKTAIGDFLQREAELTLDNLETAHDDGLIQALAVYQERNVSAIENTKIFDEHLKLLLEEIGELYERMYVPRVGSQATLAACKSHYEQAMDSLVKNRASTLTLKELGDFHKEKVRRAIAKYQEENKFALNDPSIASKCKTVLQQELEDLHDEKYAPLVSSRAALAYCVKQYKEALSDCHGDRTKLSLEYLMAKHYEWREKTIVDYEERSILSRKNPTIRQEYEKLLLNEIEDVCKKEAELRTKSNSALKEGFTLYVDVMEVYFDKNQKMSLTGLTEQHENVMARAIAAYQRSNEITKKNTLVFNGYQELMEEDIHNHFEKDARIAHLMIELQKEKQRYKICRMM